MFPAAFAQRIVAAEIADAGVRYAWAIDEENDPDPDAPGEPPPPRWRPIDGGEVTGPSTATDAEIARARTGHPFRLDYDGDGPALRGRMWASDAAHPRDSIAAFAPLDDYGRGSYGCTSICWRTASGAWAQL